jgi:hypothetical protein
MTLIDVHAAIVMVREHQEDLRRAAARRRKFEHADEVAGFGDEPVPAADAHAPVMQAWLALAAGRAR